MNKGNNLFSILMVLFFTQCISCSWLGLPKKDETPSDKAIPLGSENLNSQEAKLDYPLTSLVISDLHIGEGKEATVNTLLSVYYTAWFLEKSGNSSKVKLGKKFEVATETPFILNLGQGMLIKGWEKGLIGMKVGGVRRIWIPFMLGYGKDGMGNKIPPQMDLLYEIKLLDVK